MLKVCLNTVIISFLAKLFVLKDFMISDAWLTPPLWEKILLEWIVLSTEKIDTFPPVISYNSCAVCPPDNPLLGMPASFHIACH